MKKWRDIANWSNQNNIMLFCVCVCVHVYIYLKAGIFSSLI